MEDERRKDKAQIATLQEQIAGQAREITDATRRLSELDNTLKAAQGTLVRLLNIDHVLEEFKTDLVAMVNRLDDDRKRSEREIERIRNLSIETVQRQLNEIKVEIPRIGKIEEELPSRRAEEKRLAEMMQRMHPQIEASVHGGRAHGAALSGRRPPPGFETLAGGRTGIHQTEETRPAGRQGKCWKMRWGRWRPFRANCGATQRPRQALDDLRAGDFRLQQQVKSFESMLNRLRDQWWTTPACSTNCANRP
jgi:hypothetical protein